MGSSPAKDGETGGINIDLLKDATVDGDKTKEVDSRPRGQIKKEKRQNKKDEKQYMKYLKKNKMEGDENTFDNWKKSDDNKTSKREARRIKDIGMTPDEYTAKKEGERKQVRDFGRAISMAHGKNGTGSLNTAKMKREANEQSQISQDLLNQKNEIKIREYHDKDNEEMVLPEDTKYAVGKEGAKMDLEDTQAYKRKNKKS